MIPQTQNTLNNNNNSEISVVMIEEVQSPPLVEPHPQTSKAKNDAVLHEKINPDPSVAAADDLEDETIYPKGLQLTLLTIGTCLVMFMVCPYAVLHTW